MFEKLIAILHTVPFFIILALTTGSFLYQKVTNNNIKFDLSPTILLLTSIGIAFGFETHQHHPEEGIDSCYLCLGYALILVSVAYNIMKTTRRAVKRV